MKSATKSRDRVITLLESYGGNADAWPEKEREAAQQCIAQSEQLQALLQQAQQLDQVVSAVFKAEQDVTTETDLINMKQRIIMRLPEQQAPQPDKAESFSLDSFWRRFFILDYPVPVLLGCLVLVLSIFLVMEKPVLNNSTLTLAEYETLILESFSDSEELIQQNNELQLLAFLEPELMEEW